MGNSKNTILVLVIVVLFGASAIVLYKGFSGGDPIVGGAIPDIASGQKEIVNLLPYGEKLDFTKVKSRAATSTPFTYEAVDQNNIGVDIHALMATGGTEAQPVPVNATPKRK